MELFNSKTKPLSSKLEKRESQETPKWIKIYYALAVFYVLTSILSFFLINEIMDIYDVSVKNNEEWASDRNNVAHLSHLTTKLIAPGNDIFQSRDVVKEKKRYDYAYTQLNTEIKKTKEKFNSHPNQNYAYSIVKFIDNAELHIHKLDNHAKLIFSLFEKQEESEAAKHMTKMDRAYSNAVESFTNAGEKIGNIQSDLFTKEIAEAKRLRNSKYVVLVFAFIILAGSTFYGSKLAKTMRRSTQEIKEKEQKARQAVKRMSSVVNSVLDAIITINEKGTIESFNPAAIRIFGYTQEEVIGENVKMLMPNPYHDEHDGYLQNYMMGGKAKVIGIGREVEARRKDGSVFPMELGINDVDIDGNRVFVGIIRDISDRKQAEEEMQKQTKELADSRRRLEAVLNTVVDGIITINDRGEIQSFNPSAENILGYRAEEVIGQNIKMLMPNPYHDEHDGYLSNYLTGGDAKVIGIGREVEAKHKNGTIIPIELGISEVKIEDQRMFVGIIRDISQRKQAEDDLLKRTKELTDSQSRLEAVLSTVVDGIITINTKGVVKSFNPAAERILQYSADEVLGRNVKMLMPDPYHHEHDGYLKHYADTGEKKIIGIGREVEARKRDGTIFSMELGLSELEVSGEKMFVGIIRDVSERKKSERELEDSSECLQAVLDTVVDGIITIDEDAYISAFNPAAEKIFGYKADEVIGKNVKMLMPENYKKEHDGYVKNYLETGHAKVIGIGREVEAQRKDGSTFPMELGISEMQISGKRMFVGIIRDISERKKAERKFLKYAEDLEWKSMEAEEANDMKSDFLATMSHEIRTPMNGIFGMAELIADSELKPGQRKHIETLMSSAESLLVLIDDILDFSKIEAGKLEIDPIPINLHDIVDNISSLFSIKIQDKDVELLVRYTPKTPDHVIGDPTRIRQIISNLVSNAIKFTEKGHVLISVEKVVSTGILSENKVTIKVSVSDTGIGLEPGTQEKIFDKFSQADSSTTRNYGGTGLGLPICKSLAEMMGGEIGLDSELGKGSAFWFTMELEETAPIIVEGEEKIDISSLKGLKVLIVDDLEVNDIALTEWVNSFGMQCDTCRSAKNALIMFGKEKSNNNPYNIVIIDYMMPEINGKELGQIFNMDKTIDKTLFIMMSAFINIEHEEELKQLGFSAFLAKPIKKYQLAEVMARCWKGLHSNKDDLFDGEHFYLHQESHSKQKIYFKNSRILVAEDNRVNQEFIKEILGNLGCDVQVAKNGEEVVDMAMKNNYDLILMDCQMPIMDGFEASSKLNMLKVKHEINDIPIIALTANAMKGDKEKCIDAGMQDYMTKPVRKDQIIEMLTKWLPIKDSQTNDGLEK